MSRRPNFVATTTIKSIQGLILFTTLLCGLGTDADIPYHIPDTTSSLAVLGAGRTNGWVGMVEMGRFGWHCHFSCLTSRLTPEPIKSSL